MLYTYVPSLVKCFVFGVELVGISKDSIVTIEREESVYTFRKAQDGSQVAFVDNNPTYRVSIFLDQTSSSNEFLHTIFKLHERSGVNLKIPLAINEGVQSGGTQFSSYDCFFETEPMSEFTSDTTTREWVFICHNSSYTLRGTANRVFLTGALSATIRLIEMSDSFGIDLSNIENEIARGADFLQEQLKSLF